MRENNQPRNKLAPSALVLVGMLLRLTMILESTASKSTAEHTSKSSERSTAELVSQEAAGDTTGNSST